MLFEAEPILCARSFRHLRDLIKHLCLLLTVIPKTISTTPGSLEHSEILPPSKRKNSWESDIAYGTIAVFHKSPYCGKPFPLDILNLVRNVYFCMP